jgi:ABC-type bacteriocin/lantibiotic exporter with double-glycine peptidase domain
MLAQQLTSSGLGQVAPYQQIQPYSCGAAALKAVYQHWGEHVNEPTLIKEIGVDPETGSTAPQVTNAARLRGYLAQTRTFASIDDLASYTSRDIPVILAIRSFIRPNQGHFVVATKVTPDFVDIMDPNVRGNRRVLTRAELDKRWKFRNRIGVIVVPKRKSSQLGTEGAPKKLEAKHIFTLVVVGGFMVFAAASAGVAIYRRRKQR